MFPISPLAERLLASFLTLRLEMKIKDKGASVRHGVVVISLVGESGGRWDSAKEPEGDHGPSLGINCSVGADWSKSGRGWQGTGKNKGHRGVVSGSPSLSRSVDLWVLHIIPPIPSEVVRDCGRPPFRAPPHAHLRFTASRDEFESEPECLKGATDGATRRAARDAPSRQRM